MTVTADLDSAAAARADILRSATGREPAPAPAPNAAPTERSAEARRERKRAADRDRMRRKREAARAEREAEETPAPTASPASPASGDGRILAVVATPRPGNRELGLPTSSEVLYTRGEGATLPSAYRSLGEYLHTPRERPSVIRIEYHGALTSGSTSFDPTDREDIARKAEMLHDEGLGPANELREKLASLPEGTRTVEFTVGDA